VRGLATRPPGEASARSSESNTTTQPGDQTVPIAGWVVARFVELDLPEAVREGMASANVRPIAWLELNRVAGPSGDKPQYLVAGTRSAEGQPCDFTASTPGTPGAHATKPPSSKIICAAKCPSASTKDRRASLNSAFAR
jgi:hypothetical protein